MVDNTTDTTRPPQDERDATDTTEETLVLSVADAAELFGVSAGAIRKRLERRQLQGTKIAGQWRVILAAHEVQSAPNTTDATNATGQKPPNATRRDATNQTDATRPDTTALVAAAQAEQMAALVARIQAPLLDRIEAAVARAVTAEAERDELRRQLEELDDKTPTFVGTEQASATEEPSQNARTGPETALGATQSGEGQSDSFTGPSEPEKSARPSWWRRLIFGG